MCVGEGGRVTHPAAVAECVTIFFSFRRLMSIANGPLQLKDIGFRIVAGCWGAIMQILLLKEFRMLKWQYISVCKL